eukprot:4816089-Amphidinium_carterae.2
MLVRNQCNVGHQLDSDPNFLCLVHPTTTRFERLPACGTRVVGDFLHMRPRCSAAVSLHAAEGLFEELSRSQAPTPFTERQCGRRQLRSGPVKGSKFDFVTRYIGINMTMKPRTLVSCSPMMHLNYIRLT